MNRGEVGVFLSSSRKSAGEYAMQAIADDWATVKDQLGGTAEVIQEEGRPRIIDKRTFGNLDQPEVRKKAFASLAERVNTFVNVMRPHVRSAATDFQSPGEQATASQQVAPEKQSRLLEGAPSAALSSSTRPAISHVVWPSGVNSSARIRASALNSPFGYFST
jgi:hypothetical protein